MLLYLITAWAGAALGAVAFMNLGILHAAAAAPICASLLTFAATLIVHRYWPVPDRAARFRIGEVA